MQLRRLEVGFHSSNDWRLTDWARVTSRLEQISTHYTDITQTHSWEVSFEWTRITETGSEKQMMPLL
jgi:hypothetical protein